MLTLHRKNKCNLKDVPLISSNLEFGSTVVETSVTISIFLAIVYGIFELMMYGHVLLSTQYFVNKELRLLATQQQTIAKTASHLRLLIANNFYYDGSPIKAYPFDEEPKKIEDKLNENFYHISCKGATATNAGGHCEPLFPISIVVNYHPRFFLWHWLGKFRFRVSAMAITRAEPD